MTSIALFVISLIPPIILCVLFIWSRRSSFVLRTLILGATLVHEVLLVIFPTIYSIFTDYEVETRMLATVTADDLLMVMMGESVFILMFAVGLIVALPHLAQQAGPLVRMADRTERYILNTLIVLGCLVHAPSLFSYALGTEGSVLAQLANMLTGAFFYTPLVACAFLITKRGEFYINPGWTLLAAIPLLSLVVLGLTIGIRGRIAWVISLLILAGIYNRRKILITICLVSSIVLLPIFSVLGGLEVRGAKQSESNHAEVLAILYNEGIRYIKNYDELADLFLDTFAARAQGVRNSVALYRDSERGGGGFMTYLGAPVAFVPRMLWADKPMLGSLGHTEFEMAMFKVMDWGYGTADSTGGSMGPMLASAHAYWEGGAIWLLVAGLITGLFWNIVFRYCSRLPVISAAIIIFSFAAAHLIDGLLTMLVPLYSIIIRLWLSLLPLLLIYVGVSVIIKAGISVRANIDIRAGHQ